MRQSAANYRQSQVPSQAAAAAAQAKLLEKKKECEAVIALERASSKFLKRIESLAEDFDVVADAGVVHGQVLEQWPNMFRILDLFMQARQASDHEQQPAAQTGERLVRVPIEDLQQSSKPE